MKKELRTELTYLRDNLEDRYHKSMIIKDKILDLDLFKNSHDIALYYSMRSEVDTKELINECLKLKKNVYLPKVINNKKMIFIKIDNNTEYLKNNYGVMEPIGDITGNYFDLMIIPALGFDKDNNRLGYGRAYYDNYLKSKDVYKIGIGFKEQIVNNIPIDKNDVKMDLVITD